MHNGKNFLRVAEIGGVRLFYITSDGVIVCDGGLEVDIDSNPQLIQGLLLVEVYDDDYNHVSLLPLKDSIIEVAGLRYVLRYKYDQNIFEWQRMPSLRRKYFEKRERIGMIVRNFSLKSTPIMKKSFLKKVYKRYQQKTEKK